jgi:lipid A 3-O-deacylase
MPIRRRSGGCKQVSVAAVARPTPVRMDRAAAAVALLALLLASGGPARAQSPPPEPGPGFVDEVRVGVLAHDVRFAGGREPGADINAELLFASPAPTGWGDALPDWLAWVARPRPHVGGDLNTDGATSQVYAGLTWTIPLVSRLTLDLDFGGSANNGHVNRTVPDRKALGSNVLFRLAAELGWHFTPRLAVYALFEHVSNGDTAQFNESLNDVGLRIGFRF